MKILYVANVSDLYGASRSLLRLATRLARDCHEVEAILPSDGPLREHLEEAGVRVLVEPCLPVLTRRSLKTPLGWLRLFLQFVTSSFRIARHIRRWRPDVVHTNSAVVLSPGVAARLCRVPHVWHMREFFADLSPLWHSYQWFMAACATRIVCNSNAVASQFCRAIRKRKVIVVHNGIPAAEITPASAAAVSAFRERHGLTGSPLVGMVGRINLEQKGQDLFVEAAGLLKSRFPTARFVIAGEPYPGNALHALRLRRLISEAGLSNGVALIGHVEDIPVLHSALDISVLPARKPEGLGNVLLEAMALGKPVVGTAIGGIPEVIEDGKNGFLAPAGDAEALADALGRLLSDPSLCRRMGEDSRHRFQEQFEFETCYARVLALYASLQGGHPAPDRRVSEGILGVRVDATSYADATSRVLSWAREGQSRYVSAASVNNIMEAFDCPEFRRIMNEADLVTPDGMPLVWGLRMLGARNATRVYGPDLTPAVLAAAEREGIPVGFYGGSTPAMERLFAVVQRRFPALSVAYWFSPPFRPLSPAEDEVVIGKIRSSGARILFVGLSTPKQERWMAAHRGQIPAVMLGVGAAFDFLAGVKRQAPVWMRNCGLEWVFRFATEPRRLSRRYLKHNPRFAALFALQLLERRAAG